MQMNEEHGNFCPSSRWDITSKPEVIRNYIDGGRGIVTLANIESEVHHTYEFRLPNNPKSFGKEVLFVYTLIKENVWIYVGMYDRNVCQFKLTRRSNFGQDSKIVKGVEYILRRACCAYSGDSPMHVYHEGVCAVCGRRLTTPKSIERGIGPKCYAQIANNNAE